MIKEARWSGWVWVGECFFWYRPTRVVPDQRPLNGRCCCCISNLHTCDYCAYYALHWHFQSCEWMDCHMLVGCSSDCSVRGPGFESHHRWLHFITTATAIYSLRYGLQTFTAVPRSIQPSTLREMVKWVSAYGLSNYNNGNGGCGR